MDIYIYICIHKYLWIYIYTYIYSSVTHNIVIHELMCWVCRRCDDDAILFAIFELQPRLMSAWCDGCMVCQRKRARIWACMYTIACVYVHCTRINTHKHTYTHLACMQETHTVYKHAQIHIHTWHTWGRLTVHRQTYRQTDTHLHKPGTQETHTAQKHTHTRTHTHKQTHTHTHTDPLHASRRLIRHTHTHTQVHTITHSWHVCRRTHSLSHTWHACRRPTHRASSAGLKGSDVHM